MQIIHKKNKIVTGIGLLLALITTAYIPAAGQTKRISSLFQEIQKAGTPADQLEAFLKWADEYHSINRDSLDKYIPELMNLAETAGTSLQKSRGLLAFSNWYYRWGMSDSALLLLEPAFAAARLTEQTERDVYFKLARAKALYHGSKSRYEQSLDLLYELQEKTILYKDTLHLSLCYNTIGSVYINLNQPEKAISFILQAIAYSKDKRRFAEASAPAYINAAMAYTEKRMFDSAGYYLAKGIPLCRSIENLHYLATGLRVQSKIYTEQKKYQQAEAAILEMMELRSKIGPISNITDDYLQLASFYEQTGQLDKAIDVCKRQLYKSGLPDTLSRLESIATDPKIRLLFYEALATYLKKAKRYEDYQATLEKIVAAKDSFYAFNSALAIAEMETRYNVQIKENTILQQKYDLQRKNFLFYGTVLLVLLLGVISYFLFKDYRRQQRVKLEAALAEEKQIAEVAVKIAEENERKRIAADLHDNLGVQASAILHNAEKLKEDSATRQDLADNLHETAREMLLNLRETLWVMKTADVSAADLWLRIISFSGQMGRHYRCIKFKTEGLAPAPVQLPSAKALHIVMMVQEAVNNAAKHSGAAAVQIQSKHDESKWIILVYDNGKGYDVQKELAKTDAHGLKNIYERAVAAGVKLEVQSQQGKGTSIEIEISIG